jgi:predicted TIM-barrel fold metal-dependent hydrolase
VPSAARNSTRSAAGAVADACGEVPTPEIVAYNIGRLRAIGYLGRFDGYLRQIGLTEDERAEVPAASGDRIAQLALAAGERRGWLAAPTAHLDAVDCALTLVVGEDAGTTVDVKPVDPEALLDRYAALERDVRVYVGVDPHRPASLARALALRDHPASAGIAVSPFMAEISPDHGAYRPVFDAIAEHDLVVWIHASAHFRPSVPYDIGHPRHIDRVLIRHPRLRAIIGHAGWPWVDEACIVAVRHANVSLEFSTFPPRLLRTPGWSLEPLIANRDALAGRIFFGSGQTSDAARMERLLGEIDDLGLGDHDGVWRGAGLVGWLELAA